MPCTVADDSTSEPTLVRKFRVQKMPRLTPQFAKLNGREKNILVDSRKLIPQGKYNFAKINSYKMN